MAWSNGNVFRSITLLALEHCAAKGIELREEVLTPSLLASLIEKLEFAKIDGTFDTLIHLSPTEKLQVSQVQNTRLKEGPIGKNISTVAKLTQGEVVKFAAAAAAAMQADGMNVLIEGRAQTLDYVRTPHRFELTLSDPAIIGKRRAAQRMMAEALKALSAKPSADVTGALRDALATMAPAPARGGGKPSAEEVAAQRQLIAAYCTSHGLEATLATAVRDTVKASPTDPRLAIAASLISGSSAGQKLAGLSAALTLLATGPDAVLGADDAAAADWLLGRLNAGRPVGTYNDTVLGGHLLKCDEFADIHKLASARPHPAVWNLRQSRAGTPIFGVGQCHVEGIQFVLGQMKSKGFAGVKCVNMREEPTVFLGPSALPPPTTPVPPNPPSLVPSR